jgi:cytochrome c biogenesis protein CcdA
MVRILGAHFVGDFRIGFLDRELRVDAGDKGGSAFGAYLLGLAFAFGWTPCLGPILGAILSLAASEADVSRGTVLLAAYAFGLGIPFLLVAAFFPRLKGVMGWMKRHMDRIEKVSGLLLWTVGLMMMTGQFAAFAFGLGIPFLLVAAFFPRLKGVMSWMKRHMDRIEKVSGLLLWTVGLMMMTGQFAAFSYWLLERFPALALVG